MTRLIVLVVAGAFIALRLLQRSGHLSLRRPGGTTPTLPRFLGTTGLVAEREIRDRLRGRIFRYGTVLVVLAIVLAIVIPTLGGKSNKVQVVGIVGALAAPSRSAVIATARSIGATARLIAETNAASADTDLRSGHIALAIVDGHDIVLHKAIGPADTSTIARLARALSTSLGVEEAMRAAGLTPAQAAQLARAKPLPMRSLEHGLTRSARTTSFIGLPLLLFMFLTYNSWILMGVMEEKSSRVVEVLLATVRPLQLLAGKVLGIGLVALIQASVIVASALIAARAAGSDIARGTTPLFLASILVWLLLGYSFYCWLYAAAGSMAERRDQVQSLLVPLNLPLILGYVVALMAQSSGTPSTLVKVLAYVPLTAPFAMPALVSLHAVSWWEFAASAVLTILATFGVARLAAAVYERAILRTGQRVRLRDLFPATTS